jgi:hypothetical protein
MYHIFDTEIECQPVDILKRPGQFARVWEPGEYK